MGTDHELSALIGRYLNALEEADRLQIDGLFDEAQMRRDEAALLLASIDRDWPLAAIQAADRQQMDAIFADWQSLMSDALRGLSSGRTGITHYRNGPQFSSADREGHPGPALQLRRSSGEVAN